MKTKRFIYWLFLRFSMWFNDIIVEGEVREACSDFGMNMVIDSIVNSVLKGLRQPEVREQYGKLGVEDHLSAIRAACREYCIVDLSGLRNEEKESVSYFLVQEAEKKNDENMARTLEQQATDASDTYDAFAKR